LREMTNAKGRMTKECRMPKLEVRELAIWHGKTLS